MTREEAFKIMKRPVGGEWEYDWIRRFVELGMLKLDEPEDAFTKFKKAMDHLGYHDNSCIWRDLKTAFDVANVKIVETSSVPRPASNSEAK